MKFKGIFTTTLLAAATLHSAFAAEQNVSKAPENVSEVAEKVPNQPNLLDSVYADLFTIYHGPVLDNITSPYGVNSKGQVSKYSATYFDNELTTAVILNKDSMIGIGPDIPFWYTPVLGQGLTLGDLGLKAFEKKAVDTGNFRVYANFYFQLPTSQYSSDVRHVKYALKTTPYWWYHVQGTRLTVGSWNEVKTYVGAADYTFKLYSEPYLNYQITPKLSANLGYEMEAHHLVNKTSFDFTNYETDLQPGLVYFITPQVLVNPYVQLFTGNKITGDSAALGAVITARLL